MAVHPCPSCGQPRSGPRAACDHCDWPRQLSSFSDPELPRRRPVQFRLRSIFIFTTVACIFFALLGRYGVNGLAERIFSALLLASPVFPLIRGYFRWKSMGMDDG